MRRILRGLMVTLVGAGLLAVVYASRPDVPVGSAASQQSAAPARLASSATTRPIPTGPLPNAIVTNAVKPISLDLHKATIRPVDATGLDADAPRAELAREPRSVGWGDSYAVRLSTPAGKPMLVAHIALIAQMADGTVENIAMGALLEPGIYRATVPTHRSVPINLQVRVRYGEKSVKVPVRRLGSL